MDALLTAASFVLYAIAGYIGLMIALVLGVMVLMFIVTVWR